VPVSEFGVDFFCDEETSTDTRFTWMAELVDFKVSLLSNDIFGRINCCSITLRSYLIPAILHANPKAGTHYEISLPKDEPVISLGKPLLDCQLESLTYVDDLGVDHGSVCRARHARSAAQLASEWKASVCLCWLGSSYELDNRGIVVFDRQAGYMMVLGRSPKDPQYYERIAAVRTIYGTDAWMMSFTEQRMETITIT
jgi:hypothetical protein